MARRNYAFDVNNILSDGAAAYTAAGFGQAGGAQAIVDLGGNQGITITLPAIAQSSTITPQQARVDIAVVFYVTAMTLSGSNVYRINVVGSNNPGLNVAAGNFILGVFVLGQGAGMDPPNSANSHAPAGTGNFPAGDQYELFVTNEVQGTPLEFVSLYVAGTFGSITFTSYLAVLPRE